MVTTPTETWASLRRLRSELRNRSQREFLEAAAGAGDADRGAAVRAAVVWLGPDTDPPDWLDPLVGAVIDRTAARSESAVNVAVALGCGWGRTLRRDAGDPWAGAWERSILGLADDFLRSLALTTSLLVRLVPSVRFDRAEQRSLAEMFALELTFGCRCGRHRRTCADRVAHSCCISQHSIAAWDPDVAHLSAYVDQAVRGLAGNSIRGAAFAEGLLYAELRRTDRVRRANVEGHECSTCGRVDELACCTNGACVDRGRPTSRRVVLANRLVAPIESGGAHRAERRVVCGNRACGALIVPRPDPRCGACGWQPDVGAGVTTRQVWVRVGYDADASRGRS